MSTSNIIEFPNSGAPGEAKAKSFTDKLADLMAESLAKQHGREVRPISKEAYADLERLTEELRGHRN